jgi:hypothetical protein
MDDWGCVFRHFTGVDDGSGPPTRGYRRASSAIAAAGARTFAPAIMKM